MKIMSLVLALALLLLLGCSGNYQNKLPEIISLPNSGQNQKPAPVGSVLSFDTIKRSIFEPSCIKCHQNYNFYDSVKQDINSIVQTIETDRMPKNGPALTVEQKKLLADWVASGAPNIVSDGDGNKPTEPVPDETLAPNWNSLSRKIFFARCTTCHSSSGEAKFLDLSSRQKVFESYNKMFEGKPLINFEKPSESYLLEVIQDPDEPMPPKKSNFKQLDKAEVDVLTEWIRLGLP